MRTLCDVCEAAAARYFCAADEAALCPKCDDKVHGCNKLASRHVRLELAEAREVPSCDICASNPAYFFCGIDGTSLCLQCDMDVHVGGKRTHERYLLMGQRVQLPNSSWNEKGAVHVESLKDQQKKHSLFHLHQHDQQVHPKYSSNLIITEAPAVEIAMGEIGLRDRQGIDLNTRPQHLQSQPVLAGQSIKDNERFSSSDDKCVGVVPELSSKDMNTSDG